MIERTKRGYAVVKRAHSNLFKTSDRIFENPEDLLFQFGEYVAWLIDNPIKNDKPGFSNGTAVYAEDNKYRMPTKAGFCTHIGISRETFRLYEKREEYNEVTGYINTAIRADRLEKAAAGLYNAQVVMSLEGLSTKVENDHSSKDGTMSPNRQLSKEELKEELERRGLPSIEL